MHGGGGLLLDAVGSGDDVMKMRGVEADAQPCRAEKAPIVPIS